MSKIYCIIGKSATGKDTLYKRLLADGQISLKTITSYTTRPVRSGEREGVEYHFTDIPGFERMKAEGKVIEYRCYHTVLGDWYYFTADDGQIDLSGNQDYLFIMTLEGYEGLRNHFGNDAIVPIYIEIDSGEQLSRALNRERQQKNPNYAEMCRRFLADCEDFSEEKLSQAGIGRRFYNDDPSACAAAIVSFIRSGTHA